MSTYRNPANKSSDIFTANYTAVEKKFNRDQKQLHAFLAAIAGQMHVSYRHPYLHPDAVKQAVLEDNWSPNAGHEGHHYTGIIAFYDPDTALINHNNLGKLTTYHINSSTMVTAFLLRFPVTPYSIERGRAKQILDAVEKETGARYTGQQSPSPIHPKHSQSIYWRENLTQLDSIDAALGIDTKPAKKTGQSIGDIRQQWDAYQRYLIAKQMKADNKKPKDIAKELDIDGRSVRRLFQRWDNQEPPMNPETR